MLNEMLIATSISTVNNEQKYPFHNFDGFKLKNWLYKDAFLKHEKQVSYEVKVWQNALTQIGAIVGWNQDGQGAAARSTKKNICEHNETKR